MLLKKIKKRKPSQSIQEKKKKSKLKKLNHFLFKLKRLYTWDVKEFHK